ncbi:MAG: tRNA1(Val) (adenine(37)-N6)-methyltransferase [Hyphomicrobiaceae bacterium]
MDQAENATSEWPPLVQAAAFAGPDHETLSRDAFLDGALWVWQPRRGYRAGIDAVFLAAAAQPLVAQPHAGPLKILDAGAGVGTVGLLAAKHHQDNAANVHVTLLEQSCELAALAQRNVLENNLGDSASVVCADFLGSGVSLEAAGIARASFNLVLTNPPFYIDAHGTLPGDAIKAGAHAMGVGDLDRWVRAMAHVTCAGGEILMIHKADALAALLEALSPRFGALRILPLHPRKGKAASRIIIKGVKGSRAPLSLLPGHVLHGDGNEFTLATRGILREGAGLWL